MRICSVRAAALARSSSSAAASSGVKRARESAKAASEVYAPVSGEVVAVNDEIVGDPAKVNADAQGEGWFMKLRLAEPKQLDGLMDEAAYQAFVAEQP